MSTKKKQKWMSFTDTDGRWMQCKCCREYVKVDEGTGAITCSSCTLKKTLALKPLDEFFAKKHKPTGRPAGWHFMNEFVDKDGNVFHKGKEQPNLKGTLPPTKVKKVVRKKKKKKNLFEEAAEYKKRLRARRKSKKK